MSSSAPAEQSCPPCRFGRFALQPVDRRLLADGEPVTLGARAFDLLVALVARAGQLVSKNDLLTLVWPGLVVEENNLQVQVSTLRKLLGPTALATIPGRGYRFALPVKIAGGGNTPIHPESSKADAELARSTSATSDTGSSATTAARSSGESTSRPARARSNLPPRLPVLYGRENDLQEVVALLARHQVVSIVGAGGIGKTRLAQVVSARLADERAAEYGDGVWYVELAPLADGTLLPSAVARALDVQLGGNRSPLEDIIALLAPQRALLLLDNCEHLSDAVAEFVEALTSAAPKLRLLVTSQETLKTTGEHVYRLGPLAVPAADAVADAADTGAVELFVARAQALVPHFALTAANAAAVVEVCRRLDGIPLAIELAAARLPLLGIEGLRARLGERFNILTAGARTVLRRHQTLRATLEWSHGLLSPDEQAVLRRLGVFAGSFTLEAAQHVVQDAEIDEWAALDHLGTLVDKSLVLAEGDAVPRYRLLETTRGYALERLGEAGETDAVLRRHAEALIRLLEDYEPPLRRWHPTPEETRAASAELDNLRAALAWVTSSPTGSDLVVPLAGLSFHVWWATTHLAEGVERCLAVRKHVDDGVALPDRARYWLRVGELGLYTMRQDCYDAALRAADLYRTLGDDGLRYDALICAAAMGARLASVADMEAQIDAAAPLERAEWPARQRARLPFVRHRLYLRLDRFEEALACAQRQAEINRDGGQRVWAQIAMVNVASTEIRLNRPVAALERVRAAIAELKALGAESVAGHLYLNAAWALSTLGRPDEALIEARAAYPLLRQEGDEHRLFGELAYIAALQGRLTVAARISGRDDAVHARTYAETGGEVSPLLDKMLETGLPAEELARVRAEGAAMRDDDVFRLGFGDEVQAPQAAADRRD